MKNLKFLTLAIAILGFTATSFAQQTATETTASKATIIAPITISEVKDLNFGSIVLDGGGSMIIAPDGTLTPDGVKAYTGTITADEAHAAEYTLTGELNYTFSIAMVQTTPLTNGTNTMNLSDFTNNIGGLTSSFFDTTTKTMNVGAKLTVAANQASGDYVGEFSVTVAYN